MTQPTAINGAKVSVYRDDKRTEFAFHAEFCEFTSNQDGDSFAVVIDGQGDVHIVFSHKISFRRQS